MKNNQSVLKDVKKVLFWSEYFRLLAGEMIEIGKSPTAVNMPPGMLPQAVSPEFLETYIL